VVTDKMWVDGKMVQETRYESEKEIDAPQEEEGEDTPEWDMEEEEASWLGPGRVQAAHFVAGLCGLIVAVGATR
jgi:hypothetical protein